MSAPAKKKHKIVPFTEVTVNNATRNELLPLEKDQFDVEEELLASTISGVPHNMPKGLDFSSSPPPEDIVPEMEAQMDPGEDSS
jgi:hypothetical protein